MVKTTFKHLMKLIIEFKMFCTNHFVLNCTKNVGKVRLLLGNRHVSLEVGVSVNYFFFWLPHSMQAKGKFLFIKLTFFYLIKTTYVYKFIS
jgi:hypothetical protein